MQKDDLELKFTGKMTILVELDGYGPMQWRINDLDVVKEVCHILLNKSEKDLNVDSYDLDTERNYREMLNF